LNSSESKKIKHSDEGGMTNNPDVFGVIQIVAQKLTCGIILLIVGVGPLESYNRRKYDIAVLINNWDLFGLNRSTNEEETHGRSP
jgi:hypothetical protein